MPTTDGLRRVTSADGTEIALEQVTDGPDHLVMVSGGPSRRTSWSAVASRLAGHFSCWLMDRRGKGDSDDAGHPYSLEREYDDLVAVAGSFDRPVGLAGHSSGAVCVLGAALRGARVSSLVLYEPPWPLDGPLVAPSRIDAMDALIGAGDLDDALALAYREIVAMPEPAIEALRRSPAWAERRSLVHTWPREMREVDTLAEVGELAAVIVPTLMLVGTITSPGQRRSALAIAQAITSSTVTELDGQGHIALVTAPDLVAQAILNFRYPAR